MSQQASMTSWGKCASKSHVQCAWLKAVPWRGTERVLLLSGPSLRTVWTLGWAPGDRQEAGPALLQGSVPQAKGKLPGTGSGSKAAAKPTRGLEAGMDIRSLPIWDKGARIR